MNSMINKKEDSLDNNELDNKEDDKKSEIGLYQTEESPKNHPDNTTGSMRILLE